MIYLSYQAAMSCSASKFIAEVMPKSNVTEDYIAPSILFGSVKSGEKTTSIPLHSVNVLEDKKNGYYPTNSHDPYGVPNFC